MNGLMAWKVHGLPLGRLLLGRVALAAHMGLGQFASSIVGFDPLGYPMWA